MTTWTSIGMMTTCPRCHCLVDGTHRCPRLTNAPAQPWVMLTPQTQKARGIAALASAEFPVPARLTLTAWHEQPVHNWLAEHEDTFARPCPKRSRHGFVDSRPVRTIDEVRQVWNEARAADPEGEVVLMPRLDAQASAVLVPGLLVLGPGHDGATIKLKVPSGKTNDWGDTGICVPTP